MTLTLLGFLATVNPAAAALALTHDWRTDRPRPLLLGAAGAFGALVGLSAAAATLLDALDVNLGTYRLGAGLVIAFAGIRHLVAGAPKPVEEPSTDPGLASFVAFPVLVSPGAAALAVSIGGGPNTDEGPAVVAIGAAVAIALAAAGIYLRRSLQPAITAGAVRMLGGAATVIGVLVAVEGIRTL